VYLAELFRRYWSLELDLSSGEQVAALLDSVGADGARFLDWSADEGPSAATAIAGELRDRGLFQVPAYIVEDEVFYGRQHLPMIRWILEGRSGRVPI
jgi:2-hydroxychromene-2-carboxylate isomerase